MSTSRRAALGAILAAPLASKPVAAITCSEVESRWLALAPKLLALCEVHDRTWPLSREPYEKWCWERERSGRPWSDQDEKMPSYRAYCKARAPADEADDQAMAACKPFEGVRFKTLDAILLRHRVTMTFDWLADEAADDLTALWQEKTAA